MNEIGWVFIYVSVFGLSEYFVKEYLQNDYQYLLYYLCMGILGIYFLFTK